jgi:hypothetical protein
MLRLLQATYHRICPRIEVTKNLHGVRCRININDHFMWLVLPKTRTIEAGSHELMSRVWGTVWDVGCNFGFYAMVAARAGNDVIAFDMSPRVIAMMMRSCWLNDVAVTTVARPVTVEPRSYAEPSTSSCTNECLGGVGPLQSMTYREAEAIYGTPNFIKMDIEGGEREFLESAAFQKWLLENRITLLVEMHAGCELRAHAFPGMEQREVDSRHILISPGRQPGSGPPQG